MRLVSVCALALCVGLGACGEAVTQQDPAPAPATQTAPAQAEQAAAAGAFGYTRTQLEHADIRGADGRELGEVEAVITDASGAVIALAVEVDGPDPDPIVRLSLDGLTPVMNGDDRDLQTSMTAEQLRALPAWQRN